MSKGGDFCWYQFAGDRVWNVDPDQRQSRAVRLVFDAAQVTNGNVSLELRSVGFMRKPRCPGTFHWKFELGSVEFMGELGCSGLFRRIFELRGGDFMG